MPPDLFLSNSKAATYVGLLFIIHSLVMSIYFLLDLFQ